MAGNTPWGADIPARLAARHPGEVQVHLVVVAAVVVAAAAAAAVAVAAAAGAQVTPWCHRAARCVRRTRQSAVDYMSHNSSKTRELQILRMHQLQRGKTYPLLTVAIAIVGSSEGAKL